MIIQIHSTRSFQELSSLLVVLGQNLYTLDKLKISERLTIDSPHGIINVFREKNKDTYEVALHPYETIEGEVVKDNVPSNW